MLFFKKKVEINDDHELDYKRVYFPEKDTVQDKIVAQRAGNIEMVYYVTNDERKSGIKIITYKSNTHIIKHIKKYKSLRKVPVEYKQLIINLIVFHDKCFHCYI